MAVPAAAAAATLLLGPPGIRGARPSPEVDPSDDADAGATWSGRIGFARNNLALRADRCLDFFFQAVLVAAERPQLVRDLLPAAWDHNPITALKLVCNLRSSSSGRIRMEGFYAAVLWIHEHHSNALASNLRVLAEFGSINDFPQLLFRLIHGSDFWRSTMEKTIHKRRWRAFAFKFRRSRHLFASIGRKRPRVAEAATAVAGAEAATAVGQKRPRVAEAATAVAGAEAVTAVGRKRPRVAEAATVVAGAEIADAEAVGADATDAEALVAERMEQESKKKKQQQRQLSNGMRILAGRALNKYYTDRNYRTLFDHISQFFADLLEHDLRQTHLSQHNKISLAAKWCPRPGSPYDLSILLCEGIARHLFPRNSDSEYTDLSEEDYRLRVLRRLCHQVLKPLRKVLRQLRDRETPKTVLPQPLRQERLLTIRDLSEQHKQECLLTIRDLNEQQRRKLRNCVAVCDVSMGDRRMEVCAALSVVISGLSEYPWTHKVVTFSKKPEFYTIRGRSFQEKLNFPNRLQNDNHISIKAVFELILDTAKRFKLAPAKMVKTVFIFTNEEFDDASDHSWPQDYEVLWHRFHDAGYGHVVPQVIFWNLWGSRAVTATKDGVMRLKGFSDDLLTLFLENGGVVHAEDEMNSALAGELYEKLKIN